MAAEVAAVAGSDAALAALDILEDVGATFRELVNAKQRDAAPEGTIAVRDTLRGVNTIAAAETGKAQPAERNGVRDYLEAKLAGERKRRAQLVAEAKAEGIAPCDLPYTGHGRAVAWRDSTDRLKAFREALDRL